MIRAVGDAKRLGIAKVEDLVLPDGQTQRGSELVLMVGGNRGCEPVPRIKIGIADILPQIAMDLVGAGLDADVDDGSGGVAELGAVVGSVNLELSQSVRWRLDVVAGAVLLVVDVYVVVNAVKDEVVLGGALAVGREVACAAAAGSCCSPRAGATPAVNCAI